MNYPVCSARSQSEKEQISPGFPDTIKERSGVPYWDFHFIIRVKLGSRSVWANYFLSSAAEEMDPIDSRRPSNLFT